MQKSFRMLPFMCDQQREEVERLLIAADDIGASATSAAHGMGYEQLIQARDRFKELVLEFQNHYRIVQEEEST